MNAFDCEGCHSLGVLTWSPSWSKRLCGQCLPREERPPSWPRVSGACCNLGPVEYDGSRYCYEHWGFLDAGSPIANCDRREDNPEPFEVPC